MKICNKCRRTKEFGEFYAHTITADGFEHTCKSCRKERMRSKYSAAPEKKQARNKAWLAANSEKHAQYRRQWQEANREKMRAYSREWQKSNEIKSAEKSLKKKYGMVMRDYEVLLAAQGGVCAACKRPEREVANGKIRRLAVDHDHGTGKVRGLLCGGCNRSLGLLKENFDAAIGLAKYIQEHKGII